MCDWSGNTISSIVCLRCRAPSLRIFSPHMWLWCQMLLRPIVRFSKAIYIIAKYCIVIIVYLLWKVEHLLAFPSFKLSLWQFLKTILAYFDPKVGIVLSDIYGLSTRYIPMAQHIAQKLETLTVVKLTTVILIT